MLQAGSGETISGPIWISRDAFFLTCVRLKNTVANESALPRARSNLMSTMALKGVGIYLEQFLSSFESC